VMAGGRVNRSYYDNGGGNSVEITGDDGNTYYYAHLRDPSPLKAGQVVRAGQFLGNVGTTGNARTNNAPPHLHLGIGKGIIAGFGPDGGAGKNFDATTLLNQTLKGGAGYMVAARAGGTGTGGTRVAERLPDEEIERRVREAGEAAVQADQTIRDLNTRLDDGTQPGHALGALAGRYLPLKAELEKAQAVLEKYPKAPPRTVRNPEKDLPGAWLNPTIPDTKPNPAYDEWKRADTTVFDLTNADGTRVKVFADAKKGYEDAYEAREKRAAELRDDARKRVVALADKDYEDAKKAAENDRGIIDTESGTLINPTTGEVIANLPRDAKPGTTFTVPGRGTWLIKPDGTAQMIAGTEPRPGVRTVEAVERGPNGELVPVTYLMDDEGRVIQRLERQPSAADRNRTRVIETLVDGKPVTALVDEDAGGRIIQTYPRKQDPLEVISAPRDAEYVTYRDPATGAIKVEKNQNFDPGTRDLTGTSTTGRVYRVGRDGTAQITDVLTPEERAVYQRGEAAKVAGSEATTATALIDAATKIHDAEMKDRERAIWAEVQKVLADPNATADQIWGVIQAGAASAKDWTDLFKVHLDQRTQEEVARHNRVSESVSVQEADRQLREGLYRDINETRNQRTQAQQASNQAQSRGIIGAANSANVLSAMAPLVGSEGIRSIGTIGLGVGEEVTGPVQKSWEEHQAELQRLRDQMPAVRMANPNVPTPSFAIPRGTPAGVNIPPVTTSPIIQDMITKAGSLVGAGAKPAGSTGTAAPPAPAGEQAPGPRIEAEDLGTGMAQQWQVSPTGERTKWGDPYKITPQPEEEKPSEEEGGGGYTGDGRPRFRVPGRKRTTRAA